MVINAGLVTYGEWLKLTTKQRFEVFEIALTKIYNEKMQYYLNSQKSNY